jgi:hypothetical protein
MRNEEFAREADLSSFRIPHSAFRIPHSYSPRLPVRDEQWLRVGFVADYSCEGSGGFAPSFPITCDVLDCQCGLAEAEIASLLDVTPGIAQYRRIMIHTALGFVKVTAHHLNKAGIEAVQ